MNFDRFAARCAFVVGVTLGSALVAPAALGADAPPTTEAPAAGPRTEGPSVDAQARSLFAQGQIHYSLGEYAQAIAAFRRAYELSAAPGLLFNIAQAHRLNGQCKEALEIYRHFVRLAPDSPYRTEAETQIATLAGRCAQPTDVRSAAPSPPTVDRAASPPVLVSSPRAGGATQVAPRWSTRRRASAALLGGGIGAGLAAGIVYLWNSGRYDDWQGEDRRLAAGPQPGTSNADWLADQQRNDSLLRSIHRADTVDLVLVGVSVAAVVASAVTLVLFDR
jgi:tetratricopeptide (TPR) repeat protein